MNNLPMHMLLNRDPLVAEYLKGKRVVYVGPSPHLIGSGMGKTIDAYDVVVRVNEPTGNPDDYGSRTDILVHNLNNRYINILEAFMSGHPDFVAGLKFVFCGENYEFLNSSGTQLPNTIDNYKNNIAKFGVPLHILDQSIRHQLMLRIAPKVYVEDGVLNTAQFNNGYCGLLMVLNYEVEEVFVTGLNFYNFGNARGIYKVDGQGQIIDGVEDADKKKLKYDPAYTAHYAVGGNPDFKVNYMPLHDQLAQIRHFRDVVLPFHANVRLDDELRVGLYTKELQVRLDWHQKLSLCDWVKTERFVSPGDPPFLLHMIYRAPEQDDDKGSKALLDRESHFQIRRHIMGNGNLVFTGVKDEVTPPVKHVHVLVVVSGEMQIVLYDNNSVQVGFRTLFVGDVCVSWHGKVMANTDDRCVAYEFSMGQNLD